MQAVLDQLAKFNSPPVETLDYGNARNTPTFKNAVEEMAASSATTRAMNVAMPAMPEPVGKILRLTVWRKFLIKSANQERLKQISNFNKNAEFYGSAFLLFAKTWQQLFWKLSI